MNWRKILKDDSFPEKDRKIMRDINPETGRREKHGIREQTGAFTIDMFNKNNWKDSLGKLLSFTIKDEELGELTRGMEKVTEDAINAALQYYVTMVDTLLTETNYGDKLLEASEKFAESTKTFADEHQVSEPKFGDKGTGMMPKRVEELTNKIGKGIGESVELILEKFHEKIDREHGKGVAYEEEEGDLDFTGGIPKEVKETIWEEYLDEDMKNNLVNSTCAGVLGGLDLMDNKEYRNTLVQVLKDDPATKEFFVHLYLIVEIKLREGMPHMSSKKLERKIKDILTPEEYAWMESMAKEISIDTPMGKIGTGKIYPELDESTGIPKVEQTDPETGEKYYIPESPDEESPEWEQWQEANLSEDTSQKDWFDMLKEE